MRWPSILFVCTLRPTVRQKMVFSTASNDASSLEFVALRWSTRNPSVLARFILRWLAWRAHHVFVGCNPVASDNAVRHEIQQ
jgi:hypothetical protein